jgi:hypothetical protein
VFENRVLRRIFRPKREEVAGGWRRLHNEEIRSLYTSPNIIRVMKSRRLRRVGHVARMGKMINADSILVGKPERKRQLGTPGRRWEDNIRMDLWEIGCGCRLEAFVSGQGPVAGSCDHRNEPSVYIKGGEFLD